MLRTLLSVVGALPFIAFAQGSLQELGRASDAGQQVFDGRTGTLQGDTVPVEVTAVEVEPQFPGGQSALYAYLAKNISYPEAEKEAGIQGKVFMEFVVRSSGSITDVKVLRGDGGLAREAERVIASMPKWTPGRHNGKAVSVRYRLPINFVLQEDTDEKK